MKIRAPIGILRIKGPKNRLEQIRDAKTKTARRRALAAGGSHNDELSSAVRVYLDWLDEHRRSPDRTTRSELNKLESELRARTGWTKSRGHGTMTSYARSTGGVSMRMYVWHPESLSDYTNGVVCVVAESKAAAIALAVDARYPLASCKRGMTASEREAVVRANHATLSERSAFRAELLSEKPKVIRRGAIIEHGGS